MQPNNQIIFPESLETSRLHIRRPQLADVPQLVGFYRDGEVRRYLGGALSEQVAQERLVGMLSGWEVEKCGPWIFCERGSDIPIGICGLAMFEEIAYEVSYMLAPAFWGKGYATEAAEACLYVGFRILGQERLIGVTQQANRNSQRVLERLGMRHAYNLWRWDAPQRVYELTRDAWLENQMPTRTRRPYRQLGGE